MMKKTGNGLAIAGIIIVLCSFLLFTACQSSPPEPSTAPSPAPTALSASAETASARDEAEKFLKLALDALDANHLSEAIKHYVAVLSIAETAPAATEAAVKARAELTKIASRLSLEPQETWLAADGSQRASSTRLIGKESALLPAAYLYENYGAGKAPVPDASLAFEFVENSGVLTPFVTTDAYGLANANLSRIEDLQKPAIIRAYPLFKNRGFAYAFKSVTRDFTYLPPANTVVVASLSESKLGLLKNPLAPDRLAARFKDYGLEVLPLAGSADREGFMAALGGSAAALAGINAETKAGYALLIYVDVFNVAQMEYKGKKYNLFTASANAVARIIRPDGTVLHAIVVERVNGEGGGDEERAVDACNRAVNDAIVAAMERDAEKIRAALEQ